MHAPTPSVPRRSRGRVPALARRCAALAAAVPLVLGAAPAAFADATFPAPNPTPLPVGKSFSPVGNPQHDGKLTHFFTTTSAAIVSVDIRAADGTQVRELMAPTAKPAGTHAVTWDGKDNAGVLAADGRYSLVERLDAGGTITEIPSNVSLYTEPPAEIVSPTAGAALSGTASITLQPTHSDRPLVSATVSVTPTAGGQAGSAQASGGKIVVPYDTFGARPGQGAVSAQVHYKDEYGQQKLWNFPAASDVPVEVKNPVRVRHLNGDKLAFSPNGDGQEDTALVNWCMVGRSTNDVWVEDDAGRRVRTLVEDQLADNYWNSCWTEHTWDGRNDAGAVVPDGRYTLRMTAQGDYGAPASQSYQLQVETDLPTLISPADGGTVFGTSNPVVFAPGDVQVERVAALLTGCPDCNYTEATTRDAVTGRWQVSLDATKHPVGPLTLLSKAHWIDAFGKRHAQILPNRALDNGGARGAVSGLWPVDWFTPDGDGQHDEGRLEYDVTGGSITVRPQILTAQDALVRTLPSELKATGRHAVEWDGRNDAGDELPWGNYKVRLATLAADGTPLNVHRSTLVIRPNGPLAFDAPLAGAGVNGTFEVALHQLHPYVTEEGIDVSQVTITGSPCKPGATCSWPATRTDATRWAAAVDTTLLEPGTATLKATARFPIVANPASVHEEGPSIEVTVVDGVEITGVTPARTFSPNGDGVQDTLPVGYLLSAGAKATVQVLSGSRVVRTLVDGATQAPGAHTAAWDGKDDHGADAPDGEYTVRISAVNGSKGDVETTGAGVDRRTLGTVVVPALPTVGGRVPLAFVPRPGFTADAVELCVQTSCTPVTGAANHSYDGVVDTLGLPNGATHAEARVTWTDDQGRSQVTPVRTPITLGDDAWCLLKGTTMTAWTGNAGQLSVTRLGRDVAIRKDAQDGTICAAAVDRVDTIEVHGSHGADRFTVDLSAGLLAPGTIREADGHSEIELLADLLQGADTLRVLGSAGKDSITVSRDGVALDADGDPDLRIAGHDEVLAELGDAPDRFSAAGTGVRVVVDGGNGRDAITGGNGNDRLAGGSEADTLSGLGGDDELFGGEGHDVLSGGTQRDWLYGEAGKDRLDTKDGFGGDLADGGPDRDNVTKDLGDHVVAVP